MSDTLSFLRRYVADARLAEMTAAHAGPSCPEAVTGAAPDATLCRLLCLEAQSYALAIATADEMLDYLDARQHHRANTLVDLRRYAAQCGLLGRVSA